MARDYLAIVQRIPNQIKQKQKEPIEHILAFSWFIMFLCNFHHYIALNCVIWKFRLGYILYTENNNDS
jgi:hypothetical protein